MSAPNRTKFLGLALASAAVVAGCAIPGGGAGGDATTGADAAGAAADNPFGVVADAPLEVVVFKGGYGDDYAKYAEEVYQSAFPDADIEHAGIQNIKETLQPRFVAGDPPDVVNSSGPSALSLSALFQDDQLTDLAVLLDAPSFDDPDKTVRETLLPGTVEPLDGEYPIVNYAYTAYGFWYNETLFEEHGWEYPRTWDELLALAPQMVAAGVAPITYQGKFPSYFIDPFFSMVGKHGGAEAIYAIDNLEPGAWESESVRAAAEAIEELAARGYILDGSEGLSHTEAQQAWVDGEAALIPSGSWLENEMKSTLPADFRMAVGPTPSLSSSDALPFETMLASAAEGFLVPSAAGNVNGGLEYLRILLSKDVASKFSELTGSLSTVAGAGASVTHSPALSSAREAIEAAGPNTLSFRIGAWYPDLYATASTAMGELLAGRITADEFIARAQAEADRVAADPDIAKHTREQ